MSERMDGWRYCDDPAELAAAVADGVEVQRNWGYDWQPGTNNETAEQFAGCTKANCRYRVPASWSWSYEPPTTVTGDDLPERRVWTCKIGGRVGRLSGCADAPMRRAVADAFTAETGYPVEFCFSGWGDDLDESELAVVEDRAPDPEAIRAALVKRLTAIPPPEPPAPAAGDDLRERIARAAACAYMRVPVEAMDPRIIIEPMWPEVADAVLAVLPPLPAPPPVPPWPGAVLSGLVDEDGVPTWLAQAGQVRGEQVRGRSDFVWVNNDQMVAHLDTVWVEVRAPRAVPVPETERVPWWEAVGRVVPDVGTIREVGMSGDQAWVRCGDYDPDGVAPDGTVEVLREDGDA